MASSLKQFRAITFIDPAHIKGWTNSSLSNSSAGNHAGTLHFSAFAAAWAQNMNMCVSLTDFKYGVNTDANIGVSVTRGGNTLFEVMCIC